MNRIFLLLLLIIPTVIMAQQASNYHLMAGTYTSGKSEGIYVFDFNTDKGSVTPVSIAKGVENPSFIALGSNREYLYAVNEFSGERAGTVSAFKYNHKGELIWINTKPSNGGDPCYLAIDDANEHLVVGNYTGGNFSIFKLNDDGSLSDPIQTITHQGSSINKDRQEKPHVHSTVFSPDGDFLFVSDLGTDKIYIYPFNSKSDEPIDTSTVQDFAVQPGSGPRHLIFNKGGNIAYLIQELSAQITAFLYNKGTLQHIQTISMKPEDFKGKVGAAEIRISSDGNYLYASNRGEANNIAVFKIKEDGMLKLLQHHSTGGKTPRNFIIDPTGRYLIIANQDSDEIVIFKRNTTTGMIGALVNKINIGAPVYLLMTPVLD